MSISDSYDSIEHSSEFIDASSDRQSTQGNAPLPASGDKDEVLLQELAQIFPEPNNTAFLRSVVFRYTERYIRLILGKALSVPTEKIRTSRGALFNHMLVHGPHPKSKRPPAAGDRN